MSITEIAWEVIRSGPSLSGSRHIVYRRAYVSGSDYLAVKAEDGAFRWDVYTRREQDVAGGNRRLAGGSRPTLKAAKAAALDAWNAREER